MIIKIKIQDKEEKFFTMLFGNSYKKWQTQFQEYAIKYAPLDVISVYVSRSEWKSWGGLKWCNENEFQEELNREGVQSNEPENPKPRIYADMIFTFSDSISKQVFDISTLASLKKL